MGHAHQSTEGHQGRLCAGRAAYYHSTPFQILDILPENAQTKGISNNVPLRAVLTCTQSNSNGQLVLCRKVPFAILHRKISKTPYTVV